MSIPLPAGLSARSYDVQLACSDSAVDLVFSQAGRAEVYGLDDTGHLRPVKLASHAPISLRPDWSIDGGAVLGQVTATGAMTAVLIGDQVSEVDLRTTISSTKEQPAFVGQVGGSLFIGRITGKTLKIERG